MFLWEKQFLIHLIESSYISSCTFTFICFHYKQSTLQSENRQYYYNNPMYIPEVIYVYIVKLERKQESKNFVKILCIRRNTYEIALNKSGRSNLCYFSMYYNFVFKYNSECYAVQYVFFMNGSKLRRSSESNAQSLRVAWNSVYSIAKRKQLHDVGLFVKTLFS